MFIVTEYAALRKEFTAREFSNQQKVVPRGLSIQLANSFLGGCLLNIFKPKKISHSFQLDQSISWVVFFILFK